LSETNIFLLTTHNHNPKTDWRVHNAHPQETHSQPDSVANLMPTAEEKVALKVLKEQLSSFESVSKALQGGGSNRVHRYQSSRVMFDHLLDEFEI